MKRNMGFVDSLIRIFAALLIIVLFLTKTITGILGVVLLVVAGIFLLTAVVRFCPIYLPFGIKTIKKDTKR